MRAGMEGLGIISAIIKIHNGPADTSGWPAASLPYSLSTQVLSIEYRVWSLECRRLGILAIAEHNSLIMPGHGCGCVIWSGPAASSSQLLSCFLDSFFYLSLIFARALHCIFTRYEARWPTSGQKHKNLGASVGQVSASQASMVLVLQVQAQHEARPVTGQLYSRCFNSFKGAATVEGGGLVD